MSQINLNTASQVPLAQPSPLLQRPIGSPTPLLLIAKIVSFLAAFFFLAVAYIAVTRRSTTIEVNTLTMEVNTLTMEVNTLTMEVNTLCEAMRKFPLQDDRDKIRASLINLKPSPENKRRMVEFVAKCRVDFPRVGISDDAIKLTDDAHNCLRTAERSSQDIAYNESLRVDQKKEEMTQSYEPLLKRLQEATATLEKRWEDLEKVDQCFHQFTKNIETFKDLPCFEQYEKSKMNAKAHEALKDEEPSDQFKQQVDEFIVKYSEETFECQRTNLQTAHQDYLDMIKEVKKRMQWKLLREEIFQELTARGGAVTD